MKVTTPQPNSRTVTRQFRVASVARIFILCVAVAMLVVIAALAFRPNVTQRAVANLEARWGYVFRSADAGMFEKWSIAVGNYLRVATDNLPDVPRLVLDVPFKEMRKVYAKRDEALARGILVQGPDDFVKGEARLGEQFIPIKLRLKGDWNDHLAGRKWSFRIRARNGTNLMGMRRFSIQNPNTRGYQSELMFFDTLDRYAVMHPRYSFVDVTLNGDSMGLMALEEFFSKELLEFNRRREGVIVRFDESYAWDSKDAITGESVGWGGAFDDYRNARVDGIGSSRISESPTLSKQYRVAEGLLNGFADGVLPASQVFDVGQLGAYIAIADLFGSWHTLAWHNLRFYLNPITLKLEPIAFDATLQDHFEGENSVINDEPIVIDMMRDPLVRERYREVLGELAEGVANESLQQRLREVEDRYLPLLQTEFRMLGRFPLTYLPMRAEALLAKSENFASTGEALAFYDPREVNQYAVLAHFGLTEGNELAVESAIPRPVELRSAAWVNTATRERREISHLDFPVHLSARGLGTEPQRMVIGLGNAPADAGGWQLEVTAGLRGRSWSKVQVVGPSQLSFASGPLPAPSDVASLEYLLIDSQRQTLRVRPGTWSVSTTVVTPEGWQLIVPEGVQLRFAADASLIVNGPLQVQGSQQRPVVFGPEADSWPGIVVMRAGQTSRLQHARFEHTHSVVTDTWTLTGGVNFYRSSVVMDDVMFSDSRGEDALNIIHSDFELNGITVDGTASDAFDADFSMGTVSGGLFSNIGSAGGGDAIDVSGSEITVSGTQFRNIADKALSVGERSRMTATNVTMHTVGTGAASKDGSLLELSDSEINAPSFAGLTAYIKKPEYGPAELRATHVSFSAAETPALAQTGNRIILNGEQVAERDIDIDALYETVMKPGLRR